MRRFSLYEPCVAHITVALAARQRASFHVNDASNERGGLIKTYHKHYMDALRLLTQPGSKDRPEVLLLCCLLFISMENVDDTVSNSFLHLRSGLDVLREWKRKRLLGSPESNNSANNMIEKTLEPMFARFEAAVSPSSIYPNGQHNQVGLAWPIPDIPERFENLATARGALYEIAQWVSSQGHHQTVFSQSYSPDLQETHRLCKKWRDVLSRYQREKPIEAEKYKVSLLALETNYKLLTLLINCTTFPNEILWAKHTNVLEQMLTDIESLNRVTDVPQRRTKMSLLPRMMPALFTISMICRRKATRLRAAEIIRQVHNENHPGDECFVAVILDGIIQLEEMLEERSHSQLSGMETRVRPLVAQLIPSDEVAKGKVILTYIRPHVRPVVAEDSMLGPIVLGPPNEEIELPWDCSTTPPARTVRLWPVIEFLRLAGSSGLVGPNTGHCLCKTYGALFALMR